MLLQVSDIHVFYGKSYIIQGASLQVARGEIVALLGRNGAGKTTTLRSIMGLAKPQKGSISLDGTDITGLTPHEVARMGIGYVPQERGLFSKMSVWENLKTGGRNGRNNDRWDMVFDLFPVLKERLKQKAGTLSGGEQQMLAIARALLSNPQILLLDEPSTGLAPVMIGKLAEAIKRLNTDGLSILLVEEKISLALELSRRLYVMDVGRIVYDGYSEALQEEELLLRYMGVTAG